MQLRGPVPKVKLGRGQLWERKVCSVPDNLQVAVSPDVWANPLSLLEPPLWSEDIRITAPNLFVARIRFESWSSLHAER